MGLVSLHVLHFTGCLVGNLILQRNFVCGILKRYMYALSLVTKCRIFFVASVGPYSTCFVPRTCCVYFDVFLLVLVACTCSL
jgi:hypothetical protein